MWRGGIGGRGWERGKKQLISSSWNTVCDQDTVKFRVVTFGLCSLWDWLFSGKPSFRWFSGRKTVYAKFMKTVVKNETKFLISVSCCWHISALFQCLLHV